KSDTTNGVTGKRRVMKNAPYSLRFVHRRGRNFRIKSATASGPAGKLPVKIANHQGWATAQMISPRTTQVSWSVTFEPADIYHYPVREPANLFVDRVGLDQGCRT